VIERIRESVRGGAAWFSGAAARVFPRLYVSLVRAGESGGGAGRAAA
jgi:type II secretory pathway component PulF